jgi:HprK-related kinase A
VLIGEFARDDLVARLRGEGVHLVTGAFTFHLRITLPWLVDEFIAMYADYPVEDPPGIDDAEVRVAAPALWHRGLRGAVQTWVDGEPMFGPIPAERGYTAIESSFNWSLAESDVAPLVMHAAVLERDGRALIMPANSGSGKSTLCAALAWRGWRLFTDEVAVFDLDTGWLRANPRPVSLKNRSIDVIAAYEPRARLSRTYRGTVKGDVAYMQAPAEAVARAREPAVAGLVVTPRYREGVPARLRELGKVEGFNLLTENAVNYSSMLRTGFDMLTGVVDRCGLFELTYSSLDEAIDLIGRLHGEAASPHGRA